MRCRNTIDLTLSKMSLTNPLILSCILDYLLAPSCPCYFDENPIAKLHLLSRPIHETLKNDPALVGKAAGPRTYPSISTPKTSCQIRNRHILFSDAPYDAQGFHRLFQEGTKASRGGIRKLLRRGYRNSYGQDAMRIYTCAPVLVRDISNLTIIHYQHLSSRRAGAPLVDFIKAVEDGYVIVDLLKIGMETWASVASLFEHEKDLGGIFQLLTTQMKCTAQSLNSEESLMHGGV
ncbi:hypothetical protein DFJ77DRAFT_29984 [Powellomyces hirtus]|nr:hypothetical protein DFJ77DRAFT_29984 [Powellomyces hirtus]